MFRTRRMNVFIFLSVIFTVSLGQFLPTHRGDFVTKIGDYTFEYHDEKGLLLVMVRIDCYIVDAPKGSSVANILDDPVTRNPFLLKVKAAIEDGSNLTPTTMNAINNEYHDTLVRALCFVTEIYKLNINSLLH